MKVAISGAVILATLLAGIARGEEAAVGSALVTLSCNETMTLFAPNYPTAPTQMIETLVIDLRAGTVRGPAGTANIFPRQPHSVSIGWASPYSSNTTMCQSGNIDRVSGEYYNFVWKNSCEEVLTTLLGQPGPSLFTFEEWRGSCNPVRPMF
jgi:hypothetical protein